MTLIVKPVHSIFYILCYVLAQLTVLSAYRYCACANGLYMVSAPTN